MNSHSGVVRHTWHPVQTETFGSSGGCHQLSGLPWQHSPRTHQSPHPAVAGAHQHRRGWHYSLLDGQTNCLKNSSECFNLILPFRAHYTSKLFFMLQKRRSVLLLKYSPAKAARTSTARTFMALRPFNKETNSWLAQRGHPRVLLNQKVQLTLRADPSSSYLSLRVYLRVNLAALVLNWWACAAYIASQTVMITKSRC